MASAAVGVIRRTDAPSAIAGALAAVAGGDLAPAAPETEEEGDKLPPPSADALLPLYPPGQAWTRTLGVARIRWIWRMPGKGASGLAVCTGQGLPPFDRRLSSVMLPARAVCAASPESQALVATDGAACAWVHTMARESKGGGCWWCLLL